MLKNLKHINSNLVIDLVNGMTRRKGLLKNLLKQNTCITDIKMDHYTENFSESPTQKQFKCSLTLLLP